MSAVGKPWLKTLPDNAIALAAPVTAVALVVWIIVSVFGLVTHAWQGDPPLVSLVQQIRDSIDAINATDSPFKIEEADLEISLSVRTETGSKADVKAVSGSQSSQREQAHKLILRIRRSPAANLGPGVPVLGRTDSSASRRAAGPATRGGRP